MPSRSRRRRLRRWWLPRCRRRCSWYRRCRYRCYRRCSRFRCRCCRRCSRFPGFLRRGLVRSGLRRSVRVRPRLPVLSRGCRRRRCQRRWCRLRRRRRCRPGRCRLRRRRRCRCRGIRLRRRRRGRSMPSRSRRRRLRRWWLLRCRRRSSRCRRCRYRCYRRCSRSPGFLRRELVRSGLRRSVQGCRSEAWLSLQPVPKAHLECCSPSPVVQVPQWGCVRR